MLLVWRTPPRSDLFEAPARSRLIVVSLLPKASRNAKGKFLASKGCSASSEMACSISKAFNCLLSRHNRYVARQPTYNTTAPSSSSSSSEHHHTPVEARVCLNKSQNHAAPPAPLYSGNSPGIHRDARVAGNTSPNGTRGLSDASTPFFIKAATIPPPRRPLAPPTPAISP